MNIIQKIAATAGAITLGAAGVAAAASTPDVADAGLTKASDHVGVELPASYDAHPGADEVHDEVEGDDTDDTDEADELESEGAGIGPVDNHGADVSAVAKSDETTGREHGIAVSEVARQGHGQGPSEDHPTPP